LVGFFEKIICHLVDFFEQLSGWELEVSAHGPVLLPGVFLQQLIRMDCVS